METGRKYKEKLEKLSMIMRELGVFIDLSKGGATDSLIPSLNQDFFSVECVLFRTGASTN